ncbi:MAG: hypothetical protein ABI672_00825 [Vicinamibacteria bacterium]
MNVNLFGFSIEGLDVELSLGLARLGFVVLALAGAWFARLQRNGHRVGSIVLCIGIAGHALSWFATMFPLPNVYGANGSMDRENHLGWANMVALGFSPLRTFQVHHLHFEPLWPLLTAIASGFQIEWVQVVFQCAPLVIGILLLLSIRFAWMRGMSPSDHVSIEASFAALGALFLMSTPGDFMGAFRNPWALTFLLKPNHALGLVLVPLAALSLARAQSWKSRVWSGFVLQLVGWAFVIHMALFACSLVLFALVSWATRRLDRKKDVIDVASAIGINLLIVSPYLVMLVVAYPFLTGDDAHRLSPFSDRILDAPFRLGVLALLSAYGAVRAYRDSSRLGRVLACQWGGAQIAWQALPLLGLLGQAREQDEVFYWCRFWTGLFAGVGAFSFIRSCGEKLTGVIRSTPERSLGLSSAFTLLILLPALLPTWWNPMTMDQYFVAARKPVPDWISDPMRFVREHTPKDAVFGGDRIFARWIAAYGGRRVLLADSLNAPNDSSRRLEIDDAVLTGRSSQLMSDGRKEFGLTYILATSKEMPQAPGVTLDQLVSRADLEAVYDRQFEERRVVILRIRSEGNR